MREGDDRGWNGGVKPWGLADVISVDSYGAQWQWKAYVGGVGGESGFESSEAAAWDRARVAQAELRGRRR